ncbi:MAG TPA: Rieske 2Fe-2S domain-containing protein [Candidatus Lustribacter sp.]|nr:Rieske 2Fe-2S domain-containing protein [Candidatus Lustribacter sp.]
MIDVGNLIQGTRIHGSLYRDPDVFERELNEIWYKVWVYVAHESEIPNPGDFVRRAIGRQPVLVVRAADGTVKAFFNRCRHRGNMVCHPERGNAAAFTCPYHGWTYSNAGALLQPTFEDGYDSKLRREDFGLVPLPRLDSYRGLIFASVAPDGITLDEHLGGAKEFIDLFMDLSPTGRVSLQAGNQKLRYNGNWKFMPENSMEGDYHGPFIHKVAFELHSKKTGFDVSSLYENEIPDVIRSLPGGHMVEDYRGATMAPPNRPPSAARLAYKDAMVRAYGEEKAAQLLGTMAPLIYIFPNLMYLMTHIRVVQPVSVAETFVYYQPMLLDGAPAEINEERLRMHEFMFGAAGFISPDDIEIMERSQAALNAGGNEWLFIGRGEHRDKQLPDGGSTGFTMDENHIRGFWKHYSGVMNAGA